MHLTDIILTYRMSIFTLLFILFTYLLYRGIKKYIFVLLLFNNSFITQLRRIILQVIAIVF